MARLARLRFACIGHPDARIDDMTLDFRDGSGVATDSTIWLRNGGGKSSLLNLFFSLVQPHRRYFLGGKAEFGDRQLEEYIKYSDHAVVCAEWELPSEQPGLGEGVLHPARYLTGVFYEWKAGTAGEEGRKLGRTFFSARVDARDAALTLEGLPLYIENPATGRRSRRAMATFLAEWKGLRARWPQAEVAHVTEPKEWAQILDGIGLDPDLFRYQIRMNLQEGGADQLFSFGTVEEFVEFFLELVLDPATADQITANIKTFSAELKQRAKALLPERAMLAGLVQRLSPLQGIATRRSELTGRLRGARAQLRAAEHFVVGRQATLLQEIQRESEAAREARETAEASRDSAQEERAHGAALRLHGHGLAHRAAVASHEEAQREAVATKRALWIWEAAVPLRDVLRHQETADDIQRQLDRSKAEHAPLFAEVVDAATALVAALRARRAATAARETRLREAQAEYRRLGDAASQNAQDAVGRLASAEAAERHAEEGRQRVAAEYDALVRAGVCAHKERPEEAATRLAAARDEHTAHGVTLGRDIATARATVMERQHEAADARRLAGEARVTLQAEQSQLDAASKVASRLSMHPWLARSLDVDADGLDVRSFNSESVRVLERVAQEHAEIELTNKMESAEDHRAAHHLERTGLLPPRRDVARLLEALGQDRSGVGVWSGWAYIAANLPRRARDVIRRAPDVAEGIVVRDADFPAVATRLRADESAGTLSLDAPVTVMRQSVLHAALEDAALQGASRDGASPNGASQDGASVVVGPSSDALFDRKAGQAALVERQHRLEVADRRAAEAAEARAEVTRLAAELAAFQRQYPDSWWVDRRFGAETAGRRIREEEERERVAMRGAADAGAHVARLEEEQRRVQAALNQIERHLDGVTAFRQRHPAGLATYDAQIAAARDARRRAEAERGDALAAVEQARTAERELDGAISEAVSEGRSIDDDIARVQHARPGEAATPGADVEALRDRYAQRLAEYNRLVGEEGLQALQRKALEEARDARTQLHAKLRDGITIDDAKGALDGLSERGLADRKRDEASEAHMTALGAVGNTKNARDKAKERLDEAEKFAAPFRDRLPVLSAEEHAFESAAALRVAGEAEQRAHDADRDAIEWDAVASATEHEVRQRETRVQALGGHRKVIETIWDGYGSVIAALLGADTEGGDPVVERMSGDELVDPTLAAVKADFQTARETYEALNRERDRIVKQGMACLDEPAAADVKTQLAADLRRWDASEFEQRIEQLLHDLDVRLRQIDNLVTQIDSQRDTLIAQALGAAEDALRVLAGVERASIVPEHVPGIGGKPFLKLHFKEPTDPAEKRARLGDLIDALADEGGIAKGIEFVQRAVLSLVRPVRAEVVFPAPDRAPEYRPVTQIGKFSTGERLTCATLLYLTLASLRARVRWKQKAATGVLVCDNPFGKASRTAFIEMQREVARQAGVQLIYTTGINDFGALAMLPNVIRLRNDRQDNRTGERLIESAPSEGQLSVARLGRTTVPTARPPTVVTSGTVATGAAVAEEVS